MPVVIPTLHVQTTYVWESSLFDSGNAATVQGWNYAGHTSTDPNTVVVDITNALEANILPEVDTQITLSHVYWQTGDESGQVNSGVVGGSSHTSPPPNTTFLVSVSSGQKGPRARGRNYWPGLLSTATMDEDGTIDSGRIAELSTAFGNFGSDLGALGVVQVILQRDEPGQQSEPISPPPGVNSAVFNTKAATQRRRLRR